MVAIVGLVLFVNRQLGNMLEYVLYWVLTFPILVYTARYGVKAGVLPSICMLLLSFMISSPTTIFYLLSCVIIGLVYGGGVRAKWKNGTLLVMSGIFTFLTLLFTTVVFAAFFGYDPSEDVEMVKMLLDFLNIHAGLDIGRIIGIVVVLSAVITTVLQTICIHLLANILLSRLRIEVRPMKSLFDLRVSKTFGWGIVIIWVLFWCRNVLKLNQETASLLLALYLGAKVFAIGYGAMVLMVLLIVFQKRKLVFLVMLAMFIPYVQDVIALIGILDMVFLLRENLKRGVIYYGSTGKL